VSYLYLDASALTKLVITEPETPALQDAVRGRVMISSRVSVVEVAKAVARVDPEGDPSAILALLVLVELDAELATAAARTGGPGLRALDAIHVATAQLLGSELDTFVTYDLRQGQAARDVGLRIAAPGSS
jgi:predicted nucleic acid-binding protein